MENIPKTHPQTKEVLDSFHSEGCDPTGTAKILWTIVVVIMAAVLLIGGTIIMKI